MDGLDLFRKLSAGAKFNLKRFGNDAHRLKVIQVPKEKSTGGPPAAVIQTGTEHKRKAEHEEVGVQIKRRKDESIDDREEEEASDAEDSNEEQSSQSEEDDAMLEQNDQEEEEEEEELQLLGNIRARGNEDHKQKGRKRKLDAKQSAQKLAALKQEEVNHFRKQNRIHVYGTDIPDPAGTFEQMQEEYGLHPQIVENLKSYGYHSPTPIQMQAVPAMMHRREVLACAPTGSGKTAAFILPVLHHLKCPKKLGFRALVLSPTRELAKQTHQEFVRLSDGLGFRIHLIEKVSSAIKKFGPKTSQKFDILVTTPNRLVHLLSQDPQPIRLNNVEWLVVDESDKLFEEGKTGFRDQLATVYKACDSSNVRRAMFSATFAYPVEEWCRLNLDNLLQMYIGARNAATETVKQELVFVGSEQGKLIAVQDIIQKGLTPPVLVFVQSKERAKELFHELIYDGINVDVIHSDRTQTQRDSVVNGFRQGKIWVLICTELMGRGIDFKGVKLVINYDFPNSAITYIHRIGRTGRAGREGRAVTFFTEDDMVNLRSIANVMKEAGCPVPDYMLQMGRPNKKARKQMARKAIPRKSIRTVPQADIKKARARRKMLKYKQKKQADLSSQRSDTSEQKSETNTQKHVPIKRKNNKTNNEQKSKSTLQNGTTMKSTKHKAVKKSQIVKKKKRSKKTKVE